MGISTLDKPVKPSQLNQATIRFSSWYPVFIYTVYIHWHIDIHLVPSFFPSPHHPSYLSMDTSGSWTSTGSRTRKGRRRLRETAGNAEQMGHQTPGHFSEETYVMCHVCVFFNVFRVICRCNQEKSWVLTPANLTCCSILLWKIISFKT